MWSAGSVFLFASGLQTPQHAHEVVRGYRPNRFDIVYVAPGLDLNGVAEAPKGVVCFGANLATPGVIFLHAEDVDKGDTFCRSKVTLRGDVQQWKVWIGGSEGDFDPS
ncbi:hypothetical protein SAMN05421688_3252 [Poseidonocella pacifica]|uniref:Uncharacterized protein n=1 Tax=Poseidonocella pacifica TaxID=871651 RepID=A0A1I0YNG4_9RHOB|nr:hypothetical protein SAMN05421688_3252 [Poseidonocella pacifica]